MNRWYDMYPKLKIHFENFKNMPYKKRDKLITGVLDIIKAQNPQLLDHFVMKFPLDICRRRWYDKDPYLWLVINGLQYADSELLNAVTHFLDQNNIGKTD